MQYHKLHLITQPETLRPVMKEISEINEFIRYYEVEAPLLKKFTRQTHLEEMDLLSGYYNPDKAKIHFEELLYGGQEPENDVDQLTLNLSGILKSISTSKEDFTLSYLHKLQVALHHLLLQHQAGIGLRMETNSLFGATAEHDATLEKDTQQWLDELLKMAGSKDIPAPVRAWYFHYYFTVLKPFESNNELLAYIVSKKILVSGGFDFFNTLNLEKFVLRDKNVSLIYRQFISKEDLQARLNVDLEEYVDACNNAFLHNILHVKDAIIQVVREQLDYQTLTPRQKNSLNFWLERAFFIHKDKLSELTPRQHEMMLLIAKYGSLSNKDLVPVFMVDRKTIQRDFNTLLDMKLLDQRGGGRALKYYINLRVPLGD